jgi:hypothetical protein
MSSEPKAFRGAVGLIVQAVQMQVQPLCADTSARMQRSIALTPKISLPKGFMQRFATLCNVYFSEL